MAKQTLGSVEDDQGSVLPMPVERGVWRFDEDDFLLFALLTDGVYLPEMLWGDAGNHEYGGCYRVRDYQYPLFRPEVEGSPYIGFACARSVGKSESLKAQAFCHAFRRLGENMLISAPELIHLLPLTDSIEDKMRDVRLTREFLDVRGGQTGFQHRPFQANFMDGTKIVGRIPRITGTGVKGQHQPDMLIDEAQDYPERGWIEAHETVMKDTVDRDGNPDFRYYFYGVQSGARDSGFFKRVNAGAFEIVTATAMMRPGWSKAEKDAAKAAYGGTGSSDYRRNILGEPGSAASALFVTSRLVACFLPTTLVESNDGKRRPISEFKPGDAVRNACGSGRVQAVRRVRRREVVLVRLDDGEEIVCSREHPFFTREFGWCHADMLEPGFGLVDGAEAVRRLREAPQDEAGAFLFAQLRREMAGESGQKDRPRTHGARLRGLWQDLRSLGVGTFLRPEVHGCCQRRGATTPEEALRLLRQGLPAAKELDQAVQPRLRREDERGAQHRQSGASDLDLSGSYRNGGAVSGAVRTLARVGRHGRGLVRRVLHPAPGGHPRRAEVDSRSGAPRQQDGGGGRWQGPPGQDSDRQGPGAGRVASDARVASVQVLEPGSPEWTRLCGAGDSVELFDLTVAGHPSFCVGEAGVLVHNCLDQDRESDYNQHQYRHVEYRAEEVDEIGLPVGEIIDLPDGLKNVWAGMDLGLTNSPTVLMLFNLEKVGNKTRLKLYRRIHLARFRTRHIREVLYAMAYKYGAHLKGFGLDVTGLGFPIWQEMEDDESAPKRLLEVSRGYFFNAKVPVGVDQAFVTEDDQGNLRDQFGASVKREHDALSDSVRYVTYMPMIEASTRYLREMVDGQFLLLPFDTEITGDMQGETQQRVKAMGGVKKKPNAFHILDAMRAMAMAFRAGDVEEQLQQRGTEAVLDASVEIGGDFAYG